MINIELADYKEVLARLDKLEARLDKLEDVVKHMYSAPRTLRDDYGLEYSAEEEAELVKLAEENCKGF